MLSVDAARRFAVLALIAGASAFAACGGSSNNHRRRPTPTATTQAATATATQSAASTATATGVATSTAAPPTATGALPTSTATAGEPTATETTAAATATATAELPTATMTVQLPSPTATNAATATVTNVATATESETETPTGTPTGTTAATATATPTFTATAIPTGTTAATATPTPGAAGTAHGSVNQVYVTDAPPNSVLDLLGPGPVIVQTGTTDAFGSFIFRDVPAGDGYTVAAASDSSAVSGPVSVVDWDQPPAQSFYDNQVIGPEPHSTDKERYGYLMTRDGTLLSVMVYLPGPPDQGPYPTVIEYSGYTPSWPDNPQPSTEITSAIGYAAVGVNIRGTGCSGGAYNFFEPLQSTDGYDIIEAIAAQPWVLDHKVGMVGISFPGISQLFVAQTQPPSLEAIAPLSVISDTGRGTLYPGAILNNGFAVSWAMDRQHDAMPPPSGQSWAVDRINAGDTVCADNQKLRLQAPDILQQISDNQFYVAATADPLTPATFVHNINVPVFLAQAWQDEQVGGYAATMLDQFTGTDKVHFTLVNGNHTEPLMPAIFARWLEFLSLYVGHEIPQQTPIDQVAVDVIGSQAYTNSDEPLPSSVFTLPPDRFIGITSYEDALNLFESDPRIRILFDDGAGDPDNPGAPVPAFEHSFSAWPIPETLATRWYFGPDGTLMPDPPADESAADSLTYDNSNSQTTTFHGSNGDDIWLSKPLWDWEPLADGKAVAYVTPPLDHDVVMAGSGSLDLWFKADSADVDLQMTLSEIRPDGEEVYIQNAWGRASRRKLDDAKSTVLRPVATGAEEDVEYLPPGQYVLGRAEIFPFAHAFRAGSRIRISVEPPGGDRPLWQFQALDLQATVDISRSAFYPSSVVLPVIPNVDVPTGYPPCYLRGQPCREYRPLTNHPAAP